MACYTGFGNLADGRPLWSANFSRSNRSEVLFYYPGDDNWWLGTHNGNQLNWTDAGNTAGFGPGHLSSQLVYVGSFSPGAGGRAEVLFYNPGDDNWWLGTHNGNQLNWTDAGNTAGFGPGHLSSQLVYVGSFSPGAGGRAEVLFYNPGDDNWWLGTHNGNQLNWTDAGNTAGFGPGHLSSQLVYVGSFSPGAGGRAEVLFYNPGDDNWWLGSHNGNQLNWTDAGNTAGFGPGHLSSQLVYVGSFSPGAGGRAEVLFYNPGDDNWWLGTHNGNQLNWTDAGNTAGFGPGHLSSQLVYVGSFSPGAGGRAEVLFYNPGDDNWWLGTHNGNQLNWTDAGNTAGFGPGHLTRQLVRLGTFSPGARGRAEVLFYYNGDGNWWLGSHTSNQLTWTFAGNTGRPGRESVTIHFKSLLQLTQARQDYLANQYAAIEELFAAGGNIAVLRGTSEDLSGNPALTPLQNLNVGDCIMGTTTADQNALFQNRNNVGANDLVVYLVSTLIGGAGNFAGCAAFPAGRPGCAIVPTNARWLTAHEVGHVLGLSHVCEFPSANNPTPAVPCVNGSGQSDNLMWPNVNWTNAPPNVAGTEFQTMLRSGFTIACP